MHNYELKENVKRGEVGFPLSLYVVDGGNGLILPYHWHDEFEIYHVVSGSADVRVGDLTYPLNAGDNLMVNGGEIHAAVNTGTTHCIYQSVVFDFSMFNSILSDSSQRFMNDLSISKLSVQHEIAPECSQEIGVLIERMIESLTKRPQQYEMYVKGCLYMIFAVMSRYGMVKENSEKNNRAGNYEAIVKKSIDYISEHYKGMIYLEELAGHAQMSKYAFCRCFKQYTGVSPIEYINIFRVNTAYKLLQNTDRNVTDVAMECGFDNMSYFTKTFRKYKNMTPSQVKSTR